MVHSASCSLLVVFLVWHCWESGMFCILGDYVVRLLIVGLIIIILGWIWLIFPSWVECIWVVSLSVLFGPECILEIMWHILCPSCAQRVSSLSWGSGKYAPLLILGAFFWPDMSKWSTRSDCHPGVLWSWRSYSAAYQSALLTNYLPWGKAGVHRSRRMRSWRGGVLCAEILLAFCSRTKSRDCPISLLVSFRVWGRSAFMAGCGTPVRH